MRSPSVEEWEQEDTRCRCNVRLVLASLSVFFFAWALLIPAIVEWDFRSDLAADAALTSRHSAAFEALTSNLPGTREAQPATYSIYYFDVVNAEDVVYEGAKPNLVERGPYTYSLLFEMFDLEFSGTRRKLDFYEQTYYVFDPDQSCPGCNDTADLITTVDLAAVEVLELAKALNPLGKAAAKVILCEGEATNAARIGETPPSRPMPFTRKTVHQAHWGMWNDGTLEAVLALGLNVSELKTLSTHVPGFETNYTSHDQVVREYGGRDQIWTGGKKLSRAAKSTRYEKYMGSHFVRSCLAPTIPPNETAHQIAVCAPQDPAWDEDDDGEAEAAAHGWTLAYATRDASRVSGSTASFVKPREFNRANFGKGIFYATPRLFGNFLAKTAGLASPAVRGPRTTTVFVDSIYRALLFERTRKDGHIVRRGLPLERYQIGRGEQWIASNVSRDYDQISTPAGVLNLTRAVGLPLYGTQPHFLDADPWLLEQVNGLTPNRASHNTYFDLEPRSGEVLAVRDRLQFNGLLFDYDLPGKLKPPYAKLLQDFFPSLSNDSALSECAFDESQWTLPRRTVDGQTQWDGLVVPIGYIAKGYDLQSDDTADLQDDLADVDLVAQLGFALCLALSFALAIAACFCVRPSSDAADKDTTALLWPPSSRSSRPPRAAASRSSCCFPATAAITPDETGLTVPLYPPSNSNDDNDAFAEQEDVGPPLADL